MQRVNGSPWVDGNPSTDTTGTKITAAFMNAAQEELAGIVESAGLTLDPTNSGQIWNVLQRFFAPWMLEAATVAYASASTFTVVGDVHLIYVANRAVQLTQTSSVKGYVSADSTYSGGTGLTTVPVTVSVDAGITAVHYGQEPLNAPAPNIPTGAVMAFPISTPSSGWLECDGSQQLKATYPALYGYLKDGGSACIYGEDTTHFNLPDLRGEFLRGWAHGQTTDPDKATRTDRGDGITGDHVGTKQGDDYKTHTHQVNLSAGTTVHTEGGGSVDLGSAGGGSSDLGATISLGNSPTTDGAETRPKNVNVMYCIKY